ncbi:hypothetical protein DMB66_40810 [Actinoplanes sp. ATCC 53533]|uniref:hypothetical protein n=1 Tax=Actinoplanes sp. ATCC 53533 TaxID=1288362 RepID=UPI000F7A6D41|nr:hypothetical protein [Actinoplanes sp. ATCC 53533]RSM52096.1 hypothetical protein DMB66_40810 [Actinoplanes sp. ATCC 53533]
MGAGEFETAVQRLITQVGHWEAARWHTPARAGGGSRGEVVFALVQRLADHAADTEQRRRRPVPRLADPVLPDQLRVMADDLLAAAPLAETMISATEAVTATREAL